MKDLNMSNETTSKLCKFNEEIKKRKKIDESLVNGKHVIKEKARMI